MNNAEQIPEIIPKHDHEMVEGTKPVKHGEHEPRTMKHTTTTGPEVELAMMTEIGDGVFVQWTTCSKCRKQVAACPCAGGPQQPPYIERWRDERFDRDLNSRPDPDFRALASVISWVEAAGYVVTKDATTPEPSAEIDMIDTVDPDTPANPEAEPETEPEIADQVDSGLDDALEKVRAMKQAAADNDIHVVDIDDNF